MTNLHKQLASPNLIREQTGLAYQEAITLVDRHTLAMQYWLPTRAPKATRFTGIGTLAGASGLGTPILNQALGAYYPPDTSTKTIAAEIEAVKQFFAKREVPWLWWLGPRTTPSDMGERLTAHGMTMACDPLPAMIAALPGPEVSLKSDVCVWRAQTPDDLQAASSIRRTAFRFPEDAALTYFDDRPQDWVDGDKAHLYLARVGDGPPASIGALIEAEGIPGVYIMATFPEWQRRGLGKAILARIMSEAADKGHKVIALTASDLGYGLYRQFGFEHLFDYRLYCTVVSPKSAQV